MSKLIVLFSMSVFFFFAFLGVKGFSGILSTEDKMSREDFEMFLKSAEILSVTPDEEAGRTVPCKVVLSDGEKTLLGFFKSVDRRRPHPLADSYKYELAAYELDKIFGFYLVPPMVEREIQNRPGSLQLFLEGFVSLPSLKRRDSKFLQTEEFREAMQSTCVFENLTFCECYSEEDILVDEHKGEVYRVDFSQAFAPEYRLLDECRLDQCSRSIYQSLVSVSDKTIQERLKPFLNDSELEALLKRRKLIVEKLRSLVSLPKESLI